MYLMIPYRQTGVFIKYLFDPKAAPEWVRRWIRAMEMWYTQGSH